MSVECLMEDEDFHSQMGREAGGGGCTRKGEHVIPFFRGNTAKSISLDGV